MGNLSKIKHPGGDEQKRRQCRQRRLRNLYANTRMGAYLRKLSYLANVHPFCQSGTMLHMLGCKIFSANVLFQPYKLCAAMVHQNMRNSLFSWVATPNVSHEEHYAAIETIHAWCFQSNTQNYTCKRI